VRLQVIGSADAFNSAGRNHSCYWLDGIGAGGVMVDFGATALASLKRLGRDPRSLDGILFTHLHGDHVGGFPFLVLDGMYCLPRTAPLLVLGPRGTASRLDRVLRASYDDVADQPRPYELRVSEFGPGESRSFLGAEVRGFAASHMDPPEQPLCLRVSAGGRTVAFSGDTEMCPGLIEAAKGADLLVAECTQLRPPAGRHCTWEDWRSALSTIGAKKVLLTHLGGDVRAAIPTLLDDAPRGVDLAFADDGMVLEV
jgi:ribonuclease BN (tRNA processing enzyme)